MIFPYYLYNNVISRLSIRWVFYTLDEGYAYMLILPTCFIDKYLNTILLNLYKFWPVQVLVAISAEGCRPLVLFVATWLIRNRCTFSFKGTLCLHFLVTAGRGRSASSSIVTDWSAGSFSSVDIPLITIFKCIYTSTSLKYFKITLS